MFKYSHINTVVLALSTIIPLREQIIIKFKSNITEEIVKEVNYFSEFILGLSLSKELLAGCLIACEKSEELKKELVKMIDTFMEEDFEKFAVAYIGDKEMAEKMGLSASIIGMYSDYLDGKKWEGPNLSEDKLTARDELRELFGMKNIDFVEAYKNLVDKKVMNRAKQKLVSFDKIDLMNQLLTAYKVIEWQEQYLNELNESEE